MDCQIPKDVVKDRFDRLLKEVQDISTEETLKRVGQVLPVLVEEVNTHDDSLVTGRLSSNTVVHFNGTHDMIGKLVNVKLNEAKGFYYLGTLVE